MVVWYCTEPGGWASKGLSGEGQVGVLVSMLLQCSPPVYSFAFASGLVRSMCSVICYEFALCLCMPA